MKTWLGRVFHLLPQVKSILLYGSAFALALELFKLVPPYLMMIVIDTLIEGNQQMIFVYTVVGSILAISLITTLVEVQYFRFTAHHMFGCEISILKKGHEKLLNLSMRYHESQPSGDAVQLMNRGSAKLAELLWFVQDQFLGAFLQIILTAILLCWVNIYCGLIFATFMPVVLFLVHRSGKKVQPYRNQYHEVFRQATWEMNQSLTNIRTVKDYAQETSEKAKYSALLDRYFELAQARMLVENRDMRNRDVILGIARFAVLAYAVYLVSLGQMTTGTLVLFATLSEKVVASLYRLGRLYNHLGDSMESINQFTALFNENEQLDQSLAHQKIQRIHHRIRFENVSFCYQPNQYVLHNINLDLAARQTIALIGESGAGKSTFIKLLLRQYDASRGCVYFDDQPIQTFSPLALKNTVAVVAQDIEIFDTTIANNIAYGCDYDEQRIIAAARSAHAHEFILTMPQQYQTNVGERGLKLSGGQRQRIGIARALMRDPSLLIFDEATSSLDSESEAAIQQALAEISREKTLIMIAHRLSTIENADWVVVFERGVVTEQGTPDQLARLPGYFQRLSSMQGLQLTRQ